jgi:tetratricopeptide (TPR) repeat protein
MLPFIRFQQLAATLSSTLILAASWFAHAGDLEDANALFKKSQYDPALDKVNAVLVKTPKDVQARFLKGLILTQQNKPGDAISVFSALTSDYPELPEPYNNLAVLYANHGQYDKARQALEMAIRTHPSYATAHENLGDIYAKMASQAYDRALKLDRSNASTQTKLAMIQDLFGDAAGKTARADKGASTPLVARPPVDAVAPIDKPAMVEQPTTAADASKQVLNTLHDWAAAWSAKNTSKYLAYYAPDFKVPKGASRSSWEAERKDRIGKPKTIQVSISHPSVSFTDSDHATVEFRQSYSASHFRTASSKVIAMKRSGSKWLIQEELVK